MFGPRIVISVPPDDLKASAEFHLVPSTATQSAACPLLKTPLSVPLVVVVQFPLKGGTCHVASSLRNLVVPAVVAGLGTKPAAAEEPDLTNAP